MTTGTSLIVPATIPRPECLVPITEQEFGTRLVRIAGDTRTSIPVIGGTWHSDSRHHYSKRQPWNRDGTLYLMEQRGGTPSKLLLNAVTWKPILGNKGTSRVSTCLNNSHETRWHPGNASQMIGVSSGATKVSRFDVLSDQVFQIITTGFTFSGSTNGFMGEGNLSLDGSMLVLGDESNNAMLVNVRDGITGPLAKIVFINAPATGLDNITVSPLSTPQGGYVVCHGSDFVMIYKYGPDLVLQPHRQSLLKLSHADVGVTPSGHEVFVGGARQWYGPAGTFSDEDGNVVSIDLETGAIKAISMGTNRLGAKEAGDQHCSCRGPRGWVGVTYAGPHETTGRFVMELVLYKLDGSGECVRFGVTRTNEKLGANPYRNEAHGVWSPDGKSVAFASNWQHATIAPGSVDDVKDYVLTLDDAVPPPATTKAYEAKPFQAEYAIFDRRGMFVHPKDVERLLNEYDALKKGEN